MSRYIQTSLGKIVEITNGFAFSSDCFNFEQRGYPLLTPANFYEQGGFRDRSKRQVWFDGPIRQEYLLPARSLAVVMTEQAAGLLGAAAITPTVGLQYLHNQRLARIEPLDTTLVCIQYIYWTLAWWETRKQISVQAGGTKVRHSSVNQLRRVKVAFPSINVQTAIAGILNLFQSNIRAIACDLTYLAVCKRGLMRDLVGGQRRFPGFKSPWRQTQIAEILRVEQRPVDWNDDDVYKLASVRRWDRGMFHREELRGAEIKVKKLFSLNTDDVVVSHIQAAYGALAIAGKEFNGHKVSSMYSVFTVNQTNASIDFVRQLIKTPRMKHECYLASNGFFAERLRLCFDQDDFLRKRLHIPTSIVEQQKIGQTLALVDKKIALLTKLRNAVEKQKRGVMERLLTGEVTIPGDVVERLNAETEQEERKHVKAETKAKTTGSKP